MKFGTDGIRGPFGEEITVATGWAVGNAAVQVLGSFIAVARDTRPSGKALEDAVVAGIVAAGGFAVRFGVMPTPALSTVLAADRSWGGGVMVTASHNPPGDNGLKLLDGRGDKLGAARIAGIEKAVAREAPGGREREDPTAVDRYVSWMRARCAPVRLRIALDCANGAAFDTAGRVLELLGATVIRVDSGDGAHINDGFGALHPGPVAAVAADVGIALDGDGDRVALAVDGKILDGDAILWVCRPRPGTVVGTVMTNGGLARALAGEGSRFVRTRVGDAEVSAEMRRLDAPIGGEPSGHVLFKDGPPTADGLYAALQAIQRGVDLTGYTPDVQRHATVPAERWGSAWQPIASALASEGARVVVRPSGTEPVVRLMVEHADAGVAGRGLDKLLGAMRRRADR